MERINRGDIWTVESVSNSKPRPALIISINPVNDLCPDVLIIPITTKSGPLRIQLAENSGKTGLRNGNYAKCESLGPVSKTRLKRKIGRIFRSDLLKVEEGLRKVLAL